MFKGPEEVTIIVVETGSVVTLRYTIDEDCGGSSVLIKEILELRKRKPYKEFCSGRKYPSIV